MLLHEKRMSNISYHHYVDFSITIMHCYCVQVNTYRTGGGPHIETSLDDIELRAISFCPSQYKPLQNDVDSDGTYYISVAEMEQAQEHVVCIYNYNILLKYNII